MLRSIRPSWTQTNRIRHHVFTDGITNCLIAFDYDQTEKSEDTLAAAPAAAAVSGDHSEIIQKHQLCHDHDDPHRHPDRVLVRIYGQNTDLFIDRQTELFNLVQLYRHGLCPPVYARFNNGICYGYTPGQTVCHDWLQEQGHLTEGIANQMARMHSLELVERRGTPFYPEQEEDGDDHTANERPRQPCLPRMLSKYLGLLDVITLDKLELPSKEQLKLEADQLCQHLQQCGSPVVFCHNDLLMKNIIYRRTDGTIRFIDFEYGDFNYQAFDIGNHFCEYSGMEPFNPTRIPSRQYQERWLRAYLRFYKRYTADATDAGNSSATIGNPTITEDEIDRLFRQVCKCQLASHLMWGVWALLQAQFSTIDFGFAEYASVRINEYLRRKEEYMKLWSSQPIN